jgi:uncharacterized repeat protein (TIGR01451 family)
LAGVTIHISPGGISTVSKENGEYTVRLPIGLYKITQEIGNYWTQNCILSHTVNVTGTNQTWNGNNFSNQALTQGVDLKINMAASAQRKGFRNSIIATYTNVGTEISTSDTLKITWPNDCIPISASPGWDTIENNTTYWNLNQITVGGSGMITIIDSISVNSVVSDSITISGSITQNLNELNNSNNQVAINEEIVGAIDPNDMLVTPFGFGEEHIIKKEQELTYMIRFQNIGNFPAQNIEVSNVLPDGLDHNSFKLLNSSHSGNFIKKGNKLHWMFLNIWLPDSTNSEPESHGFIQYSIRPLKNILSGELITNKAEIVFDFESPIKTNIVYNTIATLALTNNQLIIYPNPGHSFVTLKLVEGFFWEETDIKVNVEDILGRKIDCDFSVSNGQIILNIFSLKRGIYTVTANNQGAMFSAKVVKE